MTTLSYEVTITSPKEKVWELMIGEETYNQWAQGFSEGSIFKGAWKQDETIDFYDPDQGGTRATVDVFEPHAKIALKHVAILDKQLNKAELDETGKKWIGSTEEYLFTEEDGVTSLTVNIVTDEAFRKMFDNGWPNAFAKLKELCEKA